MKKNRTKKVLANLALAGMAMTMTPSNAFADTGVTTARLFGSDRVGTAILVADAGWMTADTAILASSADANLVDVLAAAPLAGKVSPILLTDNNTLTEATKDELVKLGVKNVYVVGALNQTVVDQVNALRGVTATVLKGVDRVGTALAISSKLTNPVGSFVVGYGALADALSVASYAAAHNYSILVANPDGSLPTSEAAYKGSDVYIIGGPTLVADIPGAIRLFGADRFATNQAVVNTFTYTYDNVYVANGADAHLVDSLVASSLAAKTDAPIILTDTNGNGAATTASVRAKLAENSVVTALGGNTVVPDAVVAQLYRTGVTAPVVPPAIVPVSISTLAVSGQLVGNGELSTPAVALINDGVTVSATVSGSSAVNANITYLVSTSSNITAKDVNGKTLVASNLNSPIIIGNDTFSAFYTVPSDSSGKVNAIFSSTASSQQAFNVVVEAPFSNDGHPVRSNEASVEWGAPGTTVLSPVYTASNPKGLIFSTPGNMRGLVAVVATILPATSSTTAVNGQSIKFKMTQIGGSSDANAYFTDSTGIPMVAAGAVVGNGGSSTSAIYVVNTDANGQALVYINSNLPTSNDLANPGAVMTVSVNAQLVNGGGSTNTGNYQWKAVAQAAKIGNVSPSAMLNPTGITSGTTLVSNNAETATSGSQMTISGTLQDSAGNPVSNANVAIQDYDVVNGASNNVQNDAYVLNGTTTLFSAVNYPTVTTDSNGNFSVVVTANVPVTQSIMDSVTRYYAFYVPATIAVSTGQSLPTNVVPLSFVGNSNSGNFINLVWQQGQTAQSVGVSHNSLMPNYATLSDVPQTYPFSNVVGSDEQIYAAAYNQNGTIIAPASGNQFDGYALTYDIIAPSGMYFDFLGSAALPIDPTHGGVGEMKVQYNQTGGFVINTLYYTDGTVCYSDGTLLTVAAGPTGFDPTAYASAYDGSGQLNFYLQSSNTSAVITSGTAGSVNVNISAYSNSASTIDTNHAQGSAAGMINAAFTASNTIGSLGVAYDPSWFSSYYPLLAGNAAPPSTLSVSGVAIPVTNIYDASRNASFVVAPFNSYPAMSTIPSQGLTMNMSLSGNGVISNIDGYTLASMPSNVTFNVNRLGEVSVNNVKLWMAQSGYQVVGYLPGSTSGSVTLIEQNLSNLTSFIGVHVTGVNSAGSQVAAWTLPLNSLPGNFEGFLGFNVNSVGQLQPMVASYYKNNGNSFAPYSTEVSTLATGVYTPVEAAQVYVSDKYSESPTITITNSLNHQTATVTTSFSASTGGLVAIQSNPYNVNAVLGSSKNITLTAQDSYGNPIAYQTIYLGTGIPGLWLTQVNGTVITGSVNLGTASSISMQTVDTPVPLYSVTNAPAYNSASSVNGIIAYNLQTAPIVALTTGADGTVSITLVDGNVIYVANTASTTASNTYDVDPGTAINGKTIGFYSDNSLNTKLGSILVNWGGGSSVAVTGVSLDNPTLAMTVGGAAVPLVATISPPNATNRVLTWASSSAAVATVVNGVVTPVSEGTATITATTQDGSKIAVCTVTVAPASVALTGIGLIYGINGTAQVGTVLTGAVTPAGATATYQWQICDTAAGTYADISGATSDTYTPVVGDLGKYLKVVATGTGSYSGSVTSAATVAIAAAAAPLTDIKAISGTAQVGAVLTAGALTPAGATATYQWQISDTAAGTYADITGATSDTYTPVAGDLGKYLKVVATGTGNYTGSVTSAATIAVAVAPLTDIKGISGTAQIGVVLTAGALTPAGATATYQWQISDTAAGTYAGITGATSDTYTPVAGDLGKYLKVVATGTGSYSGSVRSSETVAIALHTTTLAKPDRPTLALGIATWTAVANENNGYSVQLYKDGIVAGAAVDIAHGAALNYDFSTAVTAVGSYTVTVKALGTGDYTDSVESDQSAAQVV